MLVVTSDDVTAGAEKSYDIAGTAGHSHTVVITAAMFEMLQQNLAITTVSSTDFAHDHSIMVACV